MVAVSSLAPSFHSFWSYFLHLSPVSYWAPTDLSSSFSVLSFCHFILFMGFSRQEYWSGLPLPSPVDLILSELSTMTRLSWVALHGMAQSFIELDKAVVHVIRLRTVYWIQKQRSRESSLLKQRFKPERVAASRETRNLSLGFQQSHEEQETKAFICSCWMFVDEIPLQSLPGRDSLGKMTPHSCLPWTFLVYTFCLCIAFNSTCFPFINTQAWTRNDIVHVLKGSLVGEWARKERKHPASDREIGRC